MNMELKNEITKFNLRENGEVDKDDKNGKISEAFKPIAETILSGHFKVSKNNSDSYVHIPEHTRSLSGSLLGYKTIP